MVLLLPWWPTDSFESELKQQKKISIPTHKTQMHSTEQAIIIKRE